MRRPAAGSTGANTAGGGLPEPRGRRRPRATQLLACALPLLLLTYLARSREASAVRGDSPPADARAADERAAGAHVAASPVDAPTDAPTKAPAMVGCLITKWDSVWLVGGEPPTRRWVRTPTAGCVARALAVDRLDSYRKATAEAYELTGAHSARACELAGCAAPRPPPAPRRCTSAAPGAAEPPPVELAGGPIVLSVRAQTGTVEAVSPASARSFSFTLPLAEPNVKLHWSGSGPVPKSLDRREHGFHHLGDVTLRVRPAASADAAWERYSTVSPTDLGVSSAELELTPRSATTDASDCLRPCGGPVRLTRHVEVDGAGARLSWTVHNGGNLDLELGGFGASMPFNQMFTGRSLSNVAEHCSFAEPYLGRGAGYVQVTRATGDGPVLLVLPDAGEFEAWRPLKQEDRANYDWMHEMLYEIVFHSKAYAQTDWRQGQLWNEPTSTVLRAGERAEFAVRLRLAHSVETVHEALLAAGVPVATPLPSSSMHVDDGGARVLVDLPPALSAVAVAVEPADAADARLTSGFGRRVVTFAPRRLGRARLVITYTRAAPASAPARAQISQSVHVYFLAPAAELVERYANHSMASAFYDAPSDPWHRSPAFRGPDADVRGPLLSEPRVFMAGLSDEAGAAAPLAMAVKQVGAPVAAEVSALERYVHETLWGGGCAAGDQACRGRFVQGRDHSVRASMLHWSDAFQARPDAAAAAAPSTAAACRKCWPKCYWMHCWSEKRSLETWRAYNYPHVEAVYWSLYRVGRHHSPPLTRRAGWEWYLRQAVRTSVAMWTFGGRGRDTSRWGLMVGSIFSLILDDAKREGWDAEVKELETIVSARVKHWLSLPFPFGSEFPWDSTGHEEITTWMLERAELVAANRTVQAVLAYASVLPSWAHCGSARRYWDFVINGKTSWGNEREYHHYGSTLNAVAVLALYRAHPAREHLLRLGACAMHGHLTTHFDSGAASMAWHGDPGLMRRDAYSGDYVRAEIAPRSRRDAARARERRGVPLATPLHSARAGHWVLRPVALLRRVHRVRPRGARVHVVRAARRRERRVRGRRWPDRRCAARRVRPDGVRGAARDRCARRRRAHHRGPCLAGRAPRIAAPGAACARAKRHGDLVGARRARLAAAAGDRR